MSGGDVAFANWVMRAQRTEGDRTVSFTPLMLARARQMYMGGMEPHECLPALRDEGLTTE